MAQRVAVVGGGVLGASTAARLAAGGAEVTLLTESTLASGASGRSLSWLNSAGPYREEYRRLRLLGLERYRALPDGGAHVRFDGGLHWGDGARDAFTRQQQVGYPAEWLSPEDVAGRVPGVDPAAVAAEGAVLNPDEGWVDLPSLVGQLVGDLTTAGGEVRTGAGRCEPVVRGGRVVGVRGGDGAVHAGDAVVLATGAAVPAALAELGVPVPDATSLALLVRTAPVDTPLHAVLNTPRVALRPAPGGGLVLDAAWSEEEVVARDDGTFEVRDATVAGLLREASHVLAGRPLLTAASWGAGRKPIPGDGQPVVGAVPGVDGLHVAFTHSGATLGLVVGELLAEEVLTGEPSSLLATFRVDRFG
ncbi:NAD(P)/FAD-dependent oxidoreductase [Modestobacter versicolor]|uniref:Glycine/D-amino acid oxidase-like deaminating enzyme n=1 Tax=Modestobacter versicolor TaxID=429133 RepID=A0A839Y140_9ACTN|nr:FAD-binding oxidoreductase [Modestobacter versicolor]MBB3676207.1 glycine/D-amino acid oxidase-like deaminating enzyme [Modestobacter versicolor]